MVAKDLKVAVEKKKAAPVYKPKHKPTRAEQTSTPIVIQAPVKPNLNDNALATWGQAVTEPTLQQVLAKVCTTVETDGGYAKFESTAEERPEVLRFPEATGNFASAQVLSVFDYEVTFLRLQTHTTPLTS